MIEKFLFEDNKGAALPKLFCQSYSDTPNITYTAGSSRTVLVATRLLSSSEEDVVVYVDCVPNNRETVDRYTALRTLSLSNDCRCIVLPIVCTEYYYLKSLPPWVIKEDVLPIVGRCIEKEWYFEEALLADHADDSYSNFEKYCKLLCDVALKRCARIERRGATKADKHPYAFSDCPCTSPLLTCCPLPLLEKSRRYLEAYPCFPGGSKHKEASLSSEELWQLHRRLVDEFNTWVDEFAQADPSTNYIHIQYIK